jgi:S-adenosylmethionine hydrolase
MQAIKLLQSCPTMLYSSFRKQAVPQTLTGKIVEVDAAGNLVTDIPSDRLRGAPTDASLRVVVDEHETYGLYPSQHSQPPMTLVAIAEGGRPLTIVLVDDSASAMLGVSVGAMVEVHW